MSETPAGLAKALAQVMAEIGKIPFDKTNQHGRYDYASVDAIFRAVRPLMGKHGLSFHMTEVAYDELVTKSRGGQRHWVVVTYEYWVAHESGVSPREQVRAMAESSMGAQVWGAAQSYAAKSALRRVLLLETGDPDSDVLEQDAGQPVREQAPARTNKVARPRSIKQEKPDLVEVRSLMNKMAKQHSVYAAKHVASHLGGDASVAKWDDDSLTSGLIALRAWAAGENKIVDELIEEGTELLHEREAIQKESEAS